MWAHKDHQRNTDQDPDYLYNRNAWGSRGCIGVVFLFSARKNEGKSSLGCQLDPRSGNLTSFHMQASS